MPGKSIVPIPSQALQPSVAKDALPKGVLLSATAQVLTHLRGGINPTVAQQVQQIEDDLRAQGQQSLLGDAAWSQIEDTVFDITPKKQSWSDWLWEKTISKTAKTLGQEWPSQREIEEQIAESFKQQVEEPDAVLERATQDDKGKKNTDADITTTHDRQRRAVPIVINPIPDQEIGCLDRFDLTINPTEVFYDADGDHLELNATLSDGSPLPDFLTYGRKRYRCLYLATTKILEHWYRCSIILPTWLQEFMICSYLMSQILLCRDYWGLMILISPDMEDT